MGRVRRGRVRARALEYDTGLAILYKLNMHLDWGDWRVEKFRNWLLSFFRSVRIGVEVGRKLNGYAVYACANSK